MAFLGIKLADGTFYPIITESEQGTTKLDLTTVENGQTTVQVDLYRSPDCKKTEFIDTLQLENLAPHKEGEQDISLTFTLGKNGNLTAEIYNAESGLRSETKINDVFSMPPNPADPASGGLSDENADESAFDDTAFDDIVNEDIGGDATDDGLSVALGEINLPKTDDTILNDMSFAMDDSADFDLAEDLDEGLGDDESPDMDDFASTNEEEYTTVGEIMDIAADEAQRDPDLTDGYAAEESAEEELDALEKELDNLTEVLSGNTDEFDDIMPMDKPPAQRTASASGAGGFTPDVSIDSSPVFEDGVVFEHHSALKVVPTTNPDAEPIPASAALNAAKLSAQAPNALGTAEPTQMGQTAESPIHHDDEEDEMADEEPKNPQSAAMVGFARLLGFFAVAACVALFMLFSGLWTIGSGGSGSLPFFGNTHNAPHEDENPAPENGENLPENLIGENLIEESDLTLIPSGDAASADFSASHAVMQNAETFTAVLTPASAEEILPKTPVKSARKEESAYYKIIWGDTLWDISYSYYKDGHFFRKIAEHNGIKNPSHIVSGTVIEIPQI